jgi:hypothetical protein
MTTTIDLFYDTAAILNSIVFGKTLWGAQGANARKNCRLWSRYIEMLRVDFRLFIVLYIALTEFSKNLLVIYCKSCILIGNRTHYLSADR